MLAETEAQGQVIARLLARSAAFGSHVMSHVEDAIGEQMVVEATIAAHLVAVAEAAGLAPEEINRRLGAITDETVLDEFWITDENGHAYLRNRLEVDFTFSPDQKKQPQAHAFWPLLRGTSRSVVQEAQQREVDTQIFKYAGVPGVDKPRIVQLGYHASFLEQLRGRMGLSRLLDEILAGGSVIEIRVVDKDMATVAYGKIPGREGPRDFGRTDLSNLRQRVHEGRTAAILERSLLKVVAPIGNEGGALQGGAVLVTLPTDHVQAAVRRQAWVVMTVGGGVLLVGSLIAVFVAQTISSPIVRLTEMTRRISSGDLSHRIEIPVQNEIGVLAASFNDMTRRLNESMQHLQETTAAKERIERELQIAHEIQMSMVPKIFPPFPHRREFDLYATLVPAKEVGGDLYDFFFIDEGRLCFTIGDVSGKGVPAALFMAVTKTLFKAATSNGGSPDEILCRLNEALCRDNASCMFVTLFSAILDIRTGWVEYSNGGHNLPYLLSNGRIEPLENTAGRVLGVTEGAKYHSNRIILQPGDGLFLYTDGVTEALDQRQNFFSERRLKAFLASVNTMYPEDLTRGLVHEVQRFSAGAAQADDITILALRYWGAQAHGRGQDIS